MDIISRAEDRIKKKPFLLAFGMNAVILMVSLVLWNGKYNSLDDYFMSSVLTGAYGNEYNVHLYFINVIYGYLLKPFYALFPKVGWYAIFQQLTVFASSTAISYVTIKRYGDKLGGMLALLLIICVSFEIYTHVAFTQCAGFATAAGVLLFAIGNAEKKRFYLFFACLFMIIGITFRKDMFLLGMPTFATILLLTVFRERSVWRWSLVALALFALIYVGLGKFDSRHYRNGGYDYYAAYQGPRAYFGDGAFYDGDNFEAELEELGRSKRDYRYLRSWYFYDNNVFHLDSLRDLINIAERSRYEPNYLKMPFAVMRALSDGLLQGRVWCWAFLCLSLIYFSNRKNWYIPWCSLFLISIPYTYLLWVNRVVGHVETGIWVYAVIFVLFFINKEDLLDSKQSRYFFQIIPLICIASLAISGTYIVFDKVSNGKNKTISAKSADWESFLKYAKARPNDVFLLPFSRYKDFAQQTGCAYTAIRPGSLSNIFSSGYWNIHLPAMNAELKKRGVDNIIKDIVKSNVYALSDERSLSLIPFYNDHYHEKLVVDTLKNFGNIELFKYRREGENESTQR